MGHMMNGKWVDDDRISADVRGAFVRADSQFRNWVTPDGSAGPSGSGGFKAEPGRYHLFDQCAHWVQWDQADRFNRLVSDFLADNR